MSDQPQEVVRMNTPSIDPILTNKVNRWALEFLAGHTLRPAVTGAIRALVLEECRNASPHVRRDLLDQHTEAFNWLLDSGARDQPEATYTHRSDDE